VYFKFTLLHEGLFKIVLRWKLFVEMIFLKSTVLRKTLVIKDFLIIVNCLFGSRDGKLLLSDSNENRSVKILPHIASRVTNHREKSKNNYENEKDFLYKWGTCVEETIILAPEIFIEIHRGLSSVPLLEMEAHPVKDVENAVIHL